MNRFFSFLLTVFFISCGSADRERQSANLPAPTIATIKKVYPVSKELKEISGICFINDHQVAAVQDETGVLFFYDFKKEGISQRLEFAEPGDYEDLALAGETMYIVNSSGTIFQIDRFPSAPGPAVKYNTPLTEKNNIEGLAYDAKRNRLLLAAKDKGLTDSDDKAIFAFDLGTKKLDTVAVYSIKLSDIEAFYKGDKLEEASKKFLKALGNQKLNHVFRTSAIALHPTTGDLFVLTSLNNMIAVISAETGKIGRIIELKGPDYNQPEGLAFTKDGRLFVSNESNGKRANIIEIEYD